MPTYEYACTACAHAFEIVQRFTDSSLTECPQCAGVLRKVFSPVGVVFKGSGFYKTDSRSSKKPATAKASGSGDSTTSESAKADSTKSESKPDSKSDSTSDSTSGSATSEPSKSGSTKTASPKAAAST